MARDISPAGARQAVEKLGRAGIVIGIPSHNNGRTIGRAVSSGGQLAVPRCSEKHPCPEVRFCFHTVQSRIQNTQRTAGTAAAN